MVAIVYAAHENRLKRFWSIGLSVLTFRHVRWLIWCRCTHHTLTQRWLQTKKSKSIECWCRSTAHILINLCCCLLFCLLIVAACAHALANHQSSSLFVPVTYTHNHIIHAHTISQFARAFWERSRRSSHSDGTWCTFAETQQFIWFAIARKRDSVTWKQRVSVVRRDWNATSFIRWFAWKICELTEHTRMMQTQIIISMCEKRQWPFPEWSPKMECKNHFLSLMSKYYTSNQ